MFSHINQPAQRSDVSCGTRESEGSDATRERGEEKKEKSREEGRKNFVPQRISDGGGYDRFKLLLISIASVHRKDTRSTFLFERGVVRARKSSFLAPGVEIRFHVLLSMLCTIGNRRVHYTFVARSLLLPSVRIYRRNYY